MINYEIIETKKKFESNKIACRYNVRCFYGKKICGLEVNLIYNRPICKDAFLKFYLTEGSVIDNNIKEKEKVVVLLNEELEKIYTNEEEGYILS